MSRWISDAVPCQGCSPEIICNGHWSKTLSNYWHVMLNPIRFSYPLLAIPEDSLIRLSHSWWLRRQSVSLQCSRPRFNPWVGKIPWRRKWQPTPVLLPRKFHGWRSLVGYSPWGHKELDMTEWLHFLSGSSKASLGMGDIFLTLSLSQRILGKG